MTKREAVLRALEITESLGGKIELAFDESNGAIRDCGTVLCYRVGSKMIRMDIRVDAEVTL